MSVGRRCQPLRTVVRAAVRSRLEQQCLGRAYELALPVIRRVLADNPSARARAASFPIPQKLVGG
jgi:hypothetical protein